MVFKLNESERWTLRHKIRSKCLNANLLFVDFFSYLGGSLNPQTRLFQIDRKDLQHLWCVCLVADYQHKFDNRFENSLFSYDNFFQLFLRFCRSRSRKKK